MEVKYKIWLENAGEKAFGLGPLKLLEGVVETGSLKRAAENLNMSYNKAWHLIKKLEKSNGFAFLERQVGGVGGGKSVLTPEAQGLMKRYNAFYEAISEKIEEEYHVFF